MELSLEQCVAHSPVLGSERWDMLADHSLEVALNAEAFAGAFGAADLAFVAGLYHDLGKRNPDWQSAIRAATEAERAGRAKPGRLGVPHAIWGAALIFLLHQNNLLPEWEELGLAIQGHHAGLADSSDSQGKLQLFFEQESEQLLAFGKELLAFSKRSGHPLPALKAVSHSATDRELFIHMLFAALVDADFLATERFGNAGKSSLRGGWPTIDEVIRRFESSRIESKPQTAIIQDVRNEVYDACLRAAESQPGLFRLTSPTGAGKTRSSLSSRLLMPRSTASAE